MDHEVLTAGRARKRILFCSTLVFLCLIFWATRHIVSLIVTIRGNGTPFGLIFSVAFLLLSWQVVLYSLERPRTVTPEEKQDLNKLRVTVMIPVYNEDNGYLRKCFVSLLSQTRLPQRIVVVDDGSSADYSNEAQWLIANATNIGVQTHWAKTPNGGKRHAQGVAIEQSKDVTDIYVTVDSDGNLAPDAIEELMKPFANPKVQSVAGIVLAENNRVNLLTRLTDMWFVMGQLIDRSAASTMGSVLVNSGVLAAYRAALIIDNLDAYLNETFFGRHVEFSDDSMLTMFALDRGLAVQQPSSFAFTAMPENVSHHIRQYTRWMRGAAIRTFYRFKYLPMNRYAYWAHAIGWVQFMMSTAIFLTLFLFDPAIHRYFSPWLLLVPVLISYGQALRYLSISRSDESFKSQLLTFSLAPLAMLWSFFVLRFVRWYAMLTCMKTGWGTRQDGIEVKAAIN